MLRRALPQVADDTVDIVSLATIGFLKKYNMIVKKIEEAGEKVVIVLEGAASRLSRLTKRQAYFVTIGGGVVTYLCVRAQDAGCFVRKRTTGEIWPLAEFPLGLLEGDPDTARDCGKIAFKDGDLYETLEVTVWDKVKKDLPFLGDIVTGVGGIGSFFTSSVKWLIGVSVVVLICAIVAFFWHKLKPTDVYDTMSQPVHLSESFVDLDKINDYSRTNKMSADFPARFINPMRTINWSERKPSLTWKREADTPHGGSNKSGRTRLLEVVDGPQTTLREDTRRYVAPTRALPSIP